MLQVDNQIKLERLYSNMTYVRNLFDNLKQQSYMITKVFEIYLS